MVIMHKGDIYRGKKDDPSKHVYHPVVVYENVTDEMDHFKAFILTDHPVSNSPIKDVPFRNVEFMDSKYPVYNSAEKVHDIVDFGYLKKVKDIKLELAGKLTEKGLTELDRIVSLQRDRKFEFVNYTLMTQADILKQKQNKK